jgi:peroxiredoxin
MRTFLSLSLVATIAACSSKPANGSAAAFKPLDVGAAVPRYAARTLAGDTVRLGGNEPPTVLNVWATWCTSCQEEMAALDSLRTEYQARGLRVVAVSVDNGDIEKVRRFAQSNHLGMTVAHDPMSTINQTYEVVGVPTTFIVGRDGTLLWRHTGNVTEVMADARATIDKALAP